MLDRIAVFAASSAQVDESFLQQARDLGSLCSKERIAVNYGGGGIGLMGELARQMLQDGGNIRGIIPTFMVELEWAFREVKDMVETSTMSRRKELLVQDVDAVVALPGGCGTLEELLEVITLKQIGQFVKPIIMVNHNNFYGHLMKMLEHCIDEKFMSPRHREIWTIVDSANDVITAIENAPKWSRDAHEFAALK